MKRTMTMSVATALGLSLLLTSSFGTFGAHPGDSTRDAEFLLGAPVDLDDVRRVTAPYHWLPMALDDGFAPFALDGGSVPTCFDRDDAGMGVHYVRNVDGSVDPLDPEALVYEVGSGGDLRLVAVEYVVPQELVEDANGAVVALPNVLGRDLHKHASLPLYVLHAWIWQENPDGMFADFNPMVATCPTI